MECEFYIHPAAAKNLQTGHQSNTAFTLWFNSETRRRWRRFKVHVTGAGTRWNAAHRAAVSETTAKEEETSPRRHSLVSEQRGEKERDRYWSALAITAHLSDIHHLTEKHTELYFFFYSPFALHQLWWYIEIFFLLLFSIMLLWPCSLVSALAPKCPLLPSCQLGELYVHIKHPEWYMPVSMVTGCLRSNHEHKIDSAMAAAATLPRGHTVAELGNLVNTSGPVRVQTNRKVIKSK